VDLFSPDTKPVRSPLAERLRPLNLREVIGQDHLVGGNGLLSRRSFLLHLPSLIFWGPPGSGKTSLARLMADEAEMAFAPLSAVLSGIREVREEVAAAALRLRQTGRKTLLFIDEIHRFNKTQQDALLPFLEDGTLTLLGATTENPSYSITSPLLSRCQVLSFKSLEIDSSVAILKRAVSDPERGLGGYPIAVGDDALAGIARLSEGDARRALNLLETAFRIAQNKDGTLFIENDTVSRAAMKRLLPYDKKGDEHYHAISALIKSMRGGDPDASVYWLARMLEAGEDPLFIGRRMIIFASEDIGNADPRALTIALASYQAFQAVGWPEGWIPLSQGVLYLATAPKSRSSHDAYLHARDALSAFGSLPVPSHLRNRPPSPESESAEPGFLPEKLAGRKFYFPSGRGGESGPPGPPGGKETERPETN
jgi:putative ATPase